MREKPTPKTTNELIRDWLKERGVPCELLPGLPGSDDPWTGGVLMDRVYGVFGTDLNACRRFERQLTGPEKTRYLAALREVLQMSETESTDSVWRMVTASAEQRCAALVRGLKLGEEEEAL